MNFKNYYEAVQKTFKFRIKSTYTLDDESMDVIEKVLAKYRPSNVTKPKKLMFQSNPLGFTGPKNVELFFIDVELTVPAAPAILENELRTGFGLLPDSDIIQVFGEHANPLAEQEEEAEVEGETEAKEALLNQPDYPEAKPVDSAEHFGDAYNKTFLAYVKDVETKRDLNKKVDAPHPITKWDKQPKSNETEPKIDDTNFNAHLTTDKPNQFKGREMPGDPRESRK